MPSGRGRPNMHRNFAAIIGEMLFCCYGLPRIDYVDSVYRLGHNIRLKLTPVFRYLSIYVYLYISLSSLLRYTLDVYILLYNNLLLFLINHTQ